MAIEVFKEKNIKLFENIANNKASHPIAVSLIVIQNKKYLKRRWGWRHNPSNPKTIINREWLK